MVELIRSNDPVKLSWLISLLADSGIEAIVFDGHASVLEGSAPGIMQRLMVNDEDAEAGRRLLVTAGELEG